MKIGALVPARLGSKRLKKKNIKPLEGRPLICWTLDVLLNSEVFSDITVSTESDEVADVVRHFYSGKDVRILNRPEALAGDDALLTDVQRHYLDHRPQMEWSGLFMPTYPFRKVDKIHEAVHQILTRYPWRVESMTSHETASMDYYFPVENGVKRFFAMPPIYCACNVCTYLFQHRNCMEDLWGRYGLAITERVYKLHTTLEEAVDIDTEDDFRTAEKVARGGRFVPERLMEHDLGEWLAIAPEGVDMEAYLDFVGRERFDDRSQPILVLEKAHPPMSFFRICDGNIRSYWISREAQTFLHSDRVKRTGNMSYMPEHFQHSPGYRFLRKPTHGGRTNYLLDSDALGILVGIGSGLGLDSVIPSDRIVHVG
ncbi:MAG: hypothetical protein HY788_10380, partial [Deltaproteobacteria bacterium]|nr:hypothetical protein [Deltaproteobacteria bacterium]